MTTISVRGFGWQYATRNAPALRNVSFEIHSGERVLLLGSSASGKSTLLRAIAGVLGDDEGTQEGTITINGMPSPALKGTCGLVLQDPQHNIILERIGDDVAFGLENLGVPADEIWPRVVEALEQVGLQRELSDSTQRLSGGQKQRLALASVLAMRPEVLALDEPTSHLDPEGVIDVIATLTSLAQQSDHPIIVVEHRVDQWWDFASRIIVLGEGGVVWDGSSQQLPRDVAHNLENNGVWLPKNLRKNSLPRLRSRNTESETVLEAENLRSGYDGTGFLSESFSSQFKNGSIHALMGPNGVGKTATALTLAGLLPPREGSVTASPALTHPLSNNNPHRWKSHELVSRVGFVFQSPEHQFVTGRVRRELEIGCEVLGLDEESVSLRVEEMLRRLRLEDVADAHPYTLSGGQQRRLSVATMMMSRPQVLICDEPTFGQDATTWNELVHLFDELRMEGHSILVITHDQDFVEAVADDVAQLGAVHEKH